MEARAEFRYLRIPDRKIRIILNLIKGKKIDIAFNILKFTNKRGADIVRKVLRSALSNISAKQGVNIENLFVAKAYANQGPSGRAFHRLHPRAMGRAAIVKKKLCHATIVLSDGIKEVKKVKGKEAS